MGLHMTWKRYVPWVLLCEGVGVLSGWLSREGFRAYGTGAVPKPPLSPPGWVFPVVWTVLFALMGAAQVSRTAKGPRRDRSMLFFLLQLAANFCWPLLFFRLQWFGAALIWLAVLWGLILAMTLAFHRVCRTAAALQIPYLLWTAFALYLNWGVWRMH